MMPLIIFMNPTGSMEGVDISFADCLAIWEVVYYCAALTFSVCISLDAGWMKGSGWIFLSIFIIIRIIGSGAHIATIDGDSDIAWTVAVISGFLGLSPLLLSTLGLVSRVWRSILGEPRNTLFSLGVVCVVQLLTAVTFILCIVGGVLANKPAEIINQDTMKAGVILYLVVVVSLFPLIVGAAVGGRKLGLGDRKLLCALAISLPLLLIRVIYSLLAVFFKDPVFDVMSKSTSAGLADLFLSRMEEMVVVLVYIVAGMAQLYVLDDNDEAQRNKEERILYGVKRSDFMTGKLGVASFAAHALINMVEGSKKDQSAHPPAERMPV